jgi:hypothetical protein
VASVVGRIRFGRTILAVVGVLMVLPAVASASTVTVNFESPAISGSSPVGPNLTTQYLPQGVEFLSAASTPVNSPVGFGMWPASTPYLYRDPGNAHSGSQVLRTWTQSGEGCFNAYAQFMGRFTTETTNVSVYAGAEVQLVPGSTPAPVELVGYDPSGNVVAQQTVKAGPKVNTLLQISTATPDIAYFSVAVLDNQGCSTPALELDDLSFVIPPTPPPPVISLVAGPPPSGPTGTPGTTASYPVTVDRFNNAVDPVTLNFSGLPAGVTAAGGITLPATTVSSQTAKVKYAIGSSASIVSQSPFTIGATTSDASAATPVTQYFTIDQPVVLQVLNPSNFVPQNSLTVPLGPCASQPLSLALTTGVGVTTPTTLAITAAGDTTGLKVGLGFASVPATNGTPSYIPLSLARTSSGGSGDVTLTIKATNPGYPDSTASVTVQRQGLTGQGMYVTQATQNDTGGLLPSGNGSSGGSYAGVELVAGKKTVVRLYADANNTPGGTPGVVAELYGFSGGTPLPGSPLQADYGPLSASGTPLTNLPQASGAAARNERVSDSELESNANAYTFTLPYSWVGGTLFDSFDPYPAATSIRLVGVVQQNLGQTVGAGCSGNETYALNNVNFSEVGYNNPAETVPIAMTVGGVYPPPTSQVFVDENAVEPVPDGSGGASITPYFASTDITSIANETNGKCSAPSSSACGSQKNSDVLSALEGLDTGACCHLVGVTLGTAYGDTDNSNNSVVQGAQGSAARPLTSVMHEVFHQFGLHHASNECGGGQDNDFDDGGEPDGDLDDAGKVDGDGDQGGGQIGVPWPPDQQGFLDGIGLNTVSEPYDFIATGLNGQANAFDFMSYCAQRGNGDPNDWVSPRNWQLLISSIGPARDIASAAGVRPAAKGTGPLVPRATLNLKVLHVTGYMTKLTGVHITSVGPQVGPKAPNGTAVDSFTLTSRGSLGQTLKRVKMAETTGGHIDGITSLVVLSAEVPSAGVDSVQISMSGKVVASRKRPKLPPTVKILAPRMGAKVGKRLFVLLRWSTTNPLKKQLTVAIDYSRDGGIRWRTMFDGPNHGHIVLPSLFFTASKKARIRVRVSDGFNQAIAISRVFTAVGAPPKATILTQLAPGTVVPGNAGLQLTGQAVDQAGKMLAAGRLRWFVDGALLGYGGAFAAPPLPPGVDQIVLLATDLAGRIGTAEITVNVAQISLPYFRYNVLPRISPAATHLQIAAESSIPATLTVGQQPFAIGQPQGPTPVVIPITPGFKPILLEMKLTANGITTPFAALVQR